MRNYPDFHSKNIPFLSSLVAILLLGIGIRTYHLYIIGFDVPFHLGGLFYEMSQQIIKNRFALPNVIPFYFPGGLPFAYPPIPFYIQSIIIEVFHPARFVTVNLLPPLFSILSLFSFVILAKKVLKTKYGFLFAVFAFAVQPVAFIEQIEAQGLAESFGTLILIWYAISLLFVYEKFQKKHILFSGLMLGACVMGSPGSAYASILTSLVFTGWMVVESIIRRSILPLANCLAIGLVGFFISSPYWFIVVSHHGIDLFITSFAAQNGSLVIRVALWLKGVFTFQMFTGAFFWNLCCYFGLLEAFFQKKFILIFYSIVLSLVPRETWVMCIAGGLCAGFAMEGLIQRFQFRSKFKEKRYRQAFQGFIIILTLVFSLVIAKTSLMNLINDREYDISTIQINDLDQFRDLIPSDASVIVAGNWGLIEWSPTILQREVLNNHFGLEWEPSKIEMARTITEAVLNNKDPNEIMNIVQNDYKNIRRVYLISDHALYQQLLVNASNDETILSPIQTGNDLNLVMIYHK